MNGEVVGWAMRQRTGSPAAKLVLVKLADNANESGFCWPSIGLIVDHTELGQSTVYKHLDHLEAIGLAEPRQHLIGHDQSGNAITSRRTNWQSRPPHQFQLVERLLLQVEKPPHAVEGPFHLLERTKKNRH